LPLFRLWRNRDRPDAFTMVAVSPLADFSFDYQDLYFTPVVTQKK